MNNINPNTSFRKLYAFGKKLPIDLSLSENPLGCSPNVLRIKNALTAADCFEYPDPDASQLVIALSRRFQVRRDNIFVTNGSESLIKLIPQMLLSPGDEVVIPALTFPMFQIATQLAGGKVVRSKMTNGFDINLVDIQRRLTSRTRLIFLCNPNNPTGKIIRKKSIIQFVKQIQAFVIVDEANIEFGGETVIQEIRRLRNLIVLRTFSKGFGLAGLRVGFCVASPDMIQALKRISQPFPVSSLAQKAAIIALEDKAFMKKTKRFMDVERTFLAIGLRKRGFTIIESQANNLLVKVVPCFQSSDDFVRKLNSKNVSVVNGTAFQALGQDFVRISPRSRKINSQFLQIVDELIEASR